MSITTPTEQCIRRPANCNCSSATFRPYYKVSTLRLYAANNNRILTRPNAHGVCFSLRRAAHQGPKAGVQPMQHLLPQRWKLHRHRRKQLQGHALHQGRSGNGYCCVRRILGLLIVLPQKKHCTVVLQYQCNLTTGAHKCGSRVLKFV